jgi:hypothetical protein
VSEIWGVVQIKAKVQLYAHLYSFCLKVGFHAFIKRMVSDFDPISRLPTANPLLRVWAIIEILRKIESRHDRPDFS